MLKKNGKSPSGIKLIWKFVKPLDSKLIRFEFYEKSRAILRKQYHRLIGRSIRTGFFAYYADHFNEHDIDENLILFDSFWGRKLTCNPYAIYREIINRDLDQEYKFIWVKSDTAIVPESIASNPRVSYVSYNTADYARALLTAKFLVSNANFIKPFVKKKEQVYLATWHGVPLKTVGFHSKEGKLFSISNTQRNFNSADIVLSGSDYSTRFIPLAYKSRCHNVWEIGHPRVDMTLNADGDTIKQQLGLTNSKMLVLYAPTYRGPIGDVADNFDIELSAIEALRDELSDKYELYVSVHNYVLTKLSRKLKGVKLVPSNIDTNEFLAAVDILVSDYSSISIDYLVLNRPVILYVPDLDIYKIERGLHQNVRQMPVAVCMTSVELLESIAAPQKPSDFKCYSDFIELVIPHDDGSASERAVDLLFSNNLSDSSLKVKYNKNESYVSKTKQRLIVYPGDLSSNAETRSFIAFSRLVDYSKYELYYVVVSHNVDSRADLKANFDEVDERAIPILRSDKMLFSQDEARKYKSLINFSNINKAGLEEYLNSAFERESQRVFCGLEYDIAIDFIGDSYFYSRLMGSINARNKVLIHHCDAHASLFGDESRVTRKGIVKKVSTFKAYRYFDSIVSLNEFDKNKNSNNMKGFYAGHASHHQIDFDFNQSCNSHVADLAQQFILSDDVDVKLANLKGVKFFIHLSIIDSGSVKALMAAMSYFVENRLEVSFLVYGTEKGINKLNLNIEALELSSRILCCTSPDHYLSLAARGDFALVANSESRFGIYCSEFQALDIKVIDLAVIAQNCDPFLINNMPNKILANGDLVKPDELTLKLIAGLQTFLISKKDDSLNESLGLLPNKQYSDNSNSIEGLLTKIST